MSVIICSCTKRHKEETILFESIDEFLPYDFLESNKVGLAEAYNYFLQKHKNRYKFIVLVHDDVFIQFPERLEETLEIYSTSYDVMGLAGAKHITIKKPTLWHIMSQREEWRGAVSHYINNGNKLRQTMITSFGPVPDRVLVIDGLFIAINTETLIDEVRFDESNTGMWHLYDIDFCLTCNKNQKKIGVIDFPVIHASPGLKSLKDKNFLSSQEWFLEKWCNT